MNRIRGAQDFWAGVLFLVFGAVMLAGASGLAQGTAARMGPGYAPRLLCGLLLLVGISLVLKGLLTEGPGTGPWNVRALVFVLGSIVFFALALERLGLVIAITLVVAISGFSVRQVRPLELAIVALAMAAGCTLMFVYGLKLIIPVWPQL